MAVLKSLNFYPLLIEPYRQITESAEVVLSFINSPFWIIQLICRKVQYSFLETTFKGTKYQHNESRTFL